MRTSPPWIHPYKQCILEILDLSYGDLLPVPKSQQVKVLIWNGRSKNVAQVWRKTWIFFKFAIAVERNKWLKQIKLPVSLHTCATFFELPYTLITIQICPSKKKTDSFNSFLIRIWPIFNWKKFNGYKFIMHLVSDQAIQMFCLHLDPNIKKTRIRMCEKQRYIKTTMICGLKVSLAKIF